MSPETAHAQAREDLTSYFGLAQAARRIPPNPDGRPPHPATLTRWVLVGVKLSDGGRLKLDAKRLPGRWIVSAEALDRFIDLLTRDRSGSPAGPAPVHAPAPISAARRRQLDDADRRLAALGM